MKVKYLVVECEYADEWGAALIPGEVVDNLEGAPCYNPDTDLCTMCSGFQDVGIVTVGTLVLRTYLGLPRIPNDIVLGDFIGDRMIMEAMPLCTSCAEILWT